MLGLGLGLNKSKKRGNLPPLPPVNIVQPFLVGTGEIGNDLVCNKGTWSGRPAPTYTYDFRVNGVSVQNTASNIYVPQPADEGFSITCLVQATNPSGSVTEGTSNSVIAGYAPVNTVAPVVSGSTSLGDTLTTTDGTFTGTAPITYTYQWKRNGVDIIGQISSTYVIGSSDSLAAITCEVKGTNTYGFDTAISNTVTVDNFAPVNTVAPTVSPSGTQSTGTLITVSVGTWTGVPTITYEYRWTRNGSPITGATNTTYTIQAADDGTTIRCEVRGTNAYGVSSYIASSNSVSAVNAVAPVNTVAPVISGSTTLGSTLTSTTGTWTGTPTPTYAYQWKRHGSNIGGAINSTYVTTLADSSANITCDVTATNTAGSATAGSNTITLPSYAPVNTVLPVVSGTAVVGQTLSTTNGTWVNSPSTFAYQWFRGATPIGTNSPSYTLVSADAGQNITCRVTATNSAGSANATSNTLAILATILDLYPNAAAAYSVRLLRGAYLSSPAIRVRRSNDNTEQDIGFTTTGELDTSALSSFVGSNNGFVVRWYDQSTNGRNAVNTTPANQPQIVSSGSVIIQGTKPIIQFTTSDFLRTSATFSMGVNRTYLMTLFNAINTSGSYKGYFCHTPTNYTDNNINGILGRFGTSNTPSSYVGSGTANTSIGNTPLATNQYFLLNALVQGGVQHQIYRNGVLNDQNLSLTINPENTARNLDIMFHPEAGNNLRTNECIVWESYQSTNRTNIESNVNTYYGIY